MTDRRESARSGRRDLLRLAGPIVIANSAVPLLGIVDTAVIGNTGTVVDLGAIALGALIFNFLYWSFGFLWMGTTGFTAQAWGAGNKVEVRATLGRALLLGSGIGIALVLLQVPIAWIALELLSGTRETEELASAYFTIRIWGAPASLGIFCVLGTFVGLGRTGQLLKTQLFLNGLNIVLDVVLAGVFGLGVRGIALGTAIAEWTTLGLALLLAHRILKESVGVGEPFWPWRRMFGAGGWSKTLAANADIIVRTLFLLAGFAWFTNQGARLGDQILAANHLLLQIITLSAYLLDGYAHATEVLVGRAVGAGQLAAFDRAARAATELAGVTAVGLACAVLLVGPAGLSALTDLSAVREVSGQYLPWTAAYVAVSFAAFQLDGIFIGATATKEMRNASILSFGLFLVASIILTPRLANLGLWIAFVFYVIARAVSLGLGYSRLAVRSGSHGAQTHSSKGRSRSARWIRLALWARQCFRKNPTSHPLYEVTPGWPTPRSGAMSRRSVAPRLPGMEGAFQGDAPEPVQVQLRRRPVMTDGHRSLGLVLAPWMMVLALVGGCGPAESSDNLGDEAMLQGEVPLSHDKEVSAAEEPSGLEEAAPATPVVPAVPSGTSMTLRLAQSLSTESNRAGDWFNGTLVGDLTSPEGDILVPAGSRTNGVVVVAQESQSADEPAVLQLWLESLEVFGKTHAVTATIVETGVRSETRDSGGETAAKIGIGTAAGALVGGIIGGDRRGALIGAGAGAVAGTAVAVTTNDGHARMEEGSIVTAVLGESLEIQ